MLSRTDALRRELVRALPERPFAVSLWDGTSVPATTDGAPTFTIRSPRALAQVLRSPGELGIGRAYVSGLIEVDDVDAAVSVVTDWEPPPIPPAARVRLGLALVRATGLVVPPPVPKIEKRQRGALHSLTRDRNAVGYHYNAGNAFFALFLDESMTYSCAVWNRGATTLAEAQQTKLELIATKLGLKQGDRLLDVGCGWGSMAIHAAREHGAQVVGITLAVEQAQLARQRVADAGLSDQIDIRIADYRELRGEQFDAICSIGMTEHVGANQIDVYAKQLHDLLRPGGVLLNHAIAQLEHGDDNEAGPFSERYVFPDGDPLHLSRIQLAIERSGLDTVAVEGFFDDYAKTLEQWTARFEANYGEAIRLVGEERARVWRVYLRAARHGFETGFEAVYQVLCRRPTGPT
jgi:cyclopropane-fatty-acyl-phospholipid synthase